MLEAVDKSHLRSMMKETFLCSAKCCDSAANQNDLKVWCASATLPFNRMTFGTGVLVSTYDHAGAVAASDETA